MPALLHPATPTNCYEPPPEKRLIRRSPKKTAPNLNSRYYTLSKPTRRHYHFTTENCKFPKYDTLVEPNWRYYVHPEGAPYWHDPLRRITTDANLQDADALVKIEAFINILCQCLSEAEVSIGPYEIVLELESDETCAYYMINHDSQAVFYLDSVYTEEIGFPEFCSIDHLNMELHRQYWVFVEYFPAHVQVPPSAEAKLLGLLIHSWGDRATSDLSTSPYSAEDCRQFVDIVQRFTDQPEQKGYKNCIVARLMESFYQARVINLYGEPGARLARNQSIQDLAEPANSVLFHIISMIMFNQPKSELEILNGLWVDTVAYTEHWRAYIGTRIEEWTGVSIMSSGILIVGTILVSHLHVQPASAHLMNDWSTKIASYSAISSMLLSISAIILGATAISVHRPHLKSHASDSGSYLANASHENYGLQPLAVVLSLPRGLFSWGLATCLVSLIAFGVQMMDKWGMIFFEAFAVSLALFILWGVHFLSTGSSFEAISLPSLSNIFRCLRPRCSTSVELV